MSGFFYKNKTQKDITRGIKAQTKRGVFGKSWIAKKWLHILNIFVATSNGRLIRGKAYARKGNIQSINIQTGQINAIVQGSYGNYEVNIKVQEINNAKWKQIINKISTQIIIVSQLTTGKFPEEIENIFERLNVTFLPRYAEDITSKCSCPDYVNPCKHIIAIFYLLSEEFDRDPFQLFNLRGLSREKLIRLLKKNLNKTLKRNNQNDKNEEFTHIKPNETTIDNSIMMKNFWNGQSSNVSFNTLQITKINISLIKQLGSLPFWSGKKSFIQEMETTYRMATLNAINFFHKS